MTFKIILLPLDSGLGYCGQTTTQCTLMVLDTASTQGQESILPCICQSSLIEVHTDTLAHHHEGGEIHSDHKEA